MTVVFRWLVDVEPIWNNHIESGALTREATARWAQGQDARNSLNLLPLAEQAKVLRFYRPIDAKLCLASFLMKHEAIAKTCSVSWSESSIGEDSNRKPCYIPPNPETPTVEFNVSHHGSLVALVGCSGSSVKLGVDVVKMNWEKDYPVVLRDGFRSWVDTYEAVFSAREVNDIATYEPPGDGSAQDRVRSKLLYFYAFWSLKEAYFKMTSEALLAPLKDVEFRNVQVPLPRSQICDSSEHNLEWGQTYSGVEIWSHGSRVTDVQLEIQAFREDYLIATASSVIDASYSAFKMFDVQSDISIIEESPEQR